MIIFLLNAVLCLSMRLDFPAILQAVGGQSIADAISDAILISLTLIVLRAAWVFLTAYGPAMIRLFAHHEYQSPDWRKVAIGWVGPRGPVSLAAALAVALIFPNRGLTIFLTYGVILAALVLQGLTLPCLVRRLGVSPAEMTNREEATAWVVAGQTALQALVNPSITDGAPPAIVKELCKHYENQIHHCECNAEGTAKPSKPSATTLSEAVRQLRLKLINAERSAVIDLRDQGTISDAAFRNVERDLDLEELREE